MSSGPLTGYRVIDFGWVIAGSWCSRLLANLGAEVIKVESTTRPDILRSYGAHPDQAPVFTDMNTGKLSVSINATTPQGRDLILRLAKISHAVVENYTPRVMPKLGLAYESLRAVNPRIVLLSAPGMGSTGPQKDYVCYGPPLFHVSGLSAITGVPGDPPTAISVGFGDFTAGAHGAFAILAALFEAARSGQGQWIDLSQFESASAMLDTTILEYGVNGVVAQPRANRDPQAAPHGAYPCLGEDRWLAIAVFTDEEWAALRGAMGDPEWARESRWDTLLGRQDHEDELDRRIADWTSTRPPEEVVAACRAANVPVSLVENMRDLMESDEQLAARGFFESVEHPVIGSYRLPGVAWKFSATPVGLNGYAGPRLGQHNDYVLKDLLGLSDAELAELAAAGVVDRNRLPPLPEPAG